RVEPGLTRASENPRLYDLPHQAFPCRVRCHFEDFRAGRGIMDQVAGEEVHLISTGACCCNPHLLALAGEDHRFCLQCDTRPPAASIWSIRGERGRISREIPDTVISPAVRSISTISPSLHGISASARGSPILMAFLKKIRAKE